MRGIFFDIKKDPEVGSPRLVWQLTATMVQASPSFASLPGVAAAFPRMGRWLPEGDCYLCSLAKPE